MCDSVELLLRGIGSSSVHARVSLIVRPPFLQSIGTIRTPVTGQIRRLNIDKAGRAEIVLVEVIEMNGARMHRSSI
jgi:hypothetical protein